LAAILRNPDVLRALHPWYAVRLLVEHGWRGFTLLGTVFLALTGTEVLYADIGHFGKQPIRRTWFCFVFPALFLNYMGQGAYLLHAGSLPENLFFRMAPVPLIAPLVALATLATVIASQAVISGTFSLARQAVQLGLWPRLRIVHTSASLIGQVYVPFVNHALLFCTAVVIVLFGSSGSLAGAYGIAVSATMAITTVLMLLIAPRLWPETSRPLLYGLGAAFLLLDLTLFGANLVKLPAGGWIVAVLAMGLAVLMDTWRRGRTRMRRIAEEQSFPLADFVQDTGRVRPVRVPGTAVFLSSGTSATPRALLHNFRHNKIVHLRTLVVAVVTEEVPVVAEEERADVTPLGEGFTQVVLHYGFMETPAVPEALARLNLPEGPFDPQRASYFLGKESLVLCRGPGMPRWRRELFATLARNAQNAAAFFGLPTNRVVELGVQVEL
jgi:KUP system potassium uptake protein